LFEGRVDNGVAWLVADGDIDFAAWKKSLTCLVSLPDFRRGMPIIADMRRGIGVPPPGTSALVAQTWRQLAPASKIALVVPQGVAYGVARQVAIHSEGRIEAFIELDEALAYLKM
jgi:hypothetical protein